MTDTTSFGEVQVAVLTPMAGWTFAYNVNADLVASTVTGSGSVTGSDGFAVLSTTATTDSSAKIETKLPVRYIPGQGARIRFACLFTEGAAGSQQIIGVGDDDDGFFFGYNGANFGVMRRRDGTDYWTLIAEWESGSEPWVQNLDYTKGNVFQIQFQWLGSGAIRFYIENPDVGGFQRVHHLKFANTAAVTSILNPTLPIMAEVTNTTNDTAIVLKTASSMGFCEGAVDNPPPPHPLALTRSLSAAKTAVTTEANVLTLSNQATWQSKTNRIRSQVRSLSVAVDGTKPAIVRLTKGTTLGGTPSYGDYNTNTSPVQYDTAGTTLTGGNVVFAAYLDKIAAEIIDLDRIGVAIAPGEKLTISVQSSVATDANVTVNWVDLL